MNLLIDAAPDTVMIGGQRCPIRANFRESILFEQLMLDRTVPDEQKLPLAINLYYPACPTDLSAAVEQMLWFYRCGKPQKPALSGGVGTERIYDYEYDDGYIFAAFLADYGIDLESVPFLHYWKYRALFESLRPENKFCRILQYRAADLHDLPDEQKRLYRRMKKLYALPRPAGEQEKMDEIADKLMHGGRL